MSARDDRVAELAMTRQERRAMEAAGDVAELESHLAARIERREAVKASLTEL